MRERKKSRLFFSGEGNDINRYFNKEKEKEKKKEKRENGKNRGRGKGGGKGRARGRPYRPIYPYSPKSQHYYQTYFDLTPENE